jgi:uncharacterized protein (TIGR00730 family)
MALRSVCVFCGSSASIPARYFSLASDVGRALAERQLRLVYGGASTGTMGALADAAVAAGGRVTGVIPAALEAREIAHRGIDDLRVVDSMSTRKKVMADESDAFVALPGGFGTLDELFEVVTWRQIHLHQKPIALLNAHGFYDGLVAWIARANGESFIPSHVAHAIDLVPDLDALTAWLDAQRADRGAAE